jgi:hypothetical protein
MHAENEPCCGDAAQENCDGCLIAWHVLLHSSFTTGAARCLFKVLLEQMDRDPYRILRMGSNCCWIPSRLPIARSRLTFLYLVQYLVGCTTPSYPPHRQLVEHQERLLIVKSRVSTASDIIRSSRTLIKKQIIKSWTFGRVIIYPAAH